MRTDWQAPFYTIKDTGSGKVHAGLENNRRFAVCGAGMRGKIVRRGRKSQVTCAGCRARLRFDGTEREYWEQR